MIFSQVLYLVIALLYIVTIIASIVVVLSENRNPIRSLAWVIALIFLPGVGLIFYLFFGRGLKGMRMVSRRNKRRLRQTPRPQRIDLNSLDLSGNNRQLVKLAYTIGSYPLTLNNKIDIFTTGLTKFESLKINLKHATQSIYLQYYIFSDDELGEEIAEILIEKASKGVDVKVIYDHVGSFSASSRFFKRMSQSGVEVHPFFRVTFPQLANRINWRNHRKICIIDNRVAYIGGMNIADRYVKGLENGLAWRDTHFRVTGDIVGSLLFSFALDWNFMNPNPAHIDLRVAKSDTINTTGMQLVTSGPVNIWDNLSLCYLQAISNAKKSIYIQTPYFLPTDALMHALEVASLSRVDVRIMIPGKSDSRLLQLATYSYVTQCLKAGIKVYVYEPGMIHAKTMTVDEDFVTAGSTNFDFRSLENNFEANLLIYDKEVNSKMRDIFFSDLEHCTKLTASEWIRRPKLQRGLESIVRLLSPIL